MAKTYEKLRRRSVKTSLTRFFSIMGIVVIGTGFLAGLMATAPDMKLTVDRYDDEYALMDVDVKGTLGVTDGDAEVLRSMEDVETVMPACVMDGVYAGSDGSDYVVRLYGVPLDQRGTAAFLNDFHLTSGRLPESPSEVVLVCPNGFILPHSVGEVYTYSDKNTDYEDRVDTYNEEVFTVVGIAQSPRYMTVETEPSGVGIGKVELIFYTFREAYSMEVYTDLFVTLRGAREMNTFTDPYTDYLTAFTDQLDPLGKERSRVRFMEVKEDAQQEIDDAQAEFDDTKADTEQDIADAQQKLDDAGVELDDAKLELTDAKSDYDDGKKKYDDAHYAFYKERNAALKKIEDGKTQLRKMAADGLLDYATYSGMMEDLNKTKEDVEEQFSQAHGELSKAKEELDQGELDLADAEEKLADAETELAEKQQELDDAKADAEEQLADAQQKINDAQQELDDLEEPEWIVSDRSDMVSYSSYKSNTEKIDAIAKVFPIFLFLVAALVALTTMTRMVEEERTQIGTLKALGYGDGQIMSYYLSYSALASVLGAVLGMALGFRLLPTVISTAYSMMYTIPPIITVFRWSTAFVIAPIAILCTTGATYAACRSALREKPSLLMLPRAPKAGKRILLERIGFLWKPLKFTQKVTCRNIFRYKKRLYMTVFGIAGCTALLLTGFGLRDSINDIVEKQFFELYRFDCTIYLKDGDVLSENRELADYLDHSGKITGYAPVHSESGTVTVSSGASGDATIYVPENTEELKKYILLRERRSGADVPFHEDSCLLTEKMCEQLKLRVGDSFTLSDDDGNTAVLKVSGIVENYVTSYVFLSAPAFREALHKEPEFDRVIANIDSTDSAEEGIVSTRLLAIEDVSLVSFNSSIRESFDNLIGNINYIVYVLIAAAGALAMLVLYNLTNINISERKKELATIKVLGFYEGEVARYIYRETTMLCILGILVGYAFGVWLHAFVVSTAEVDAVMFGRTLYFSSFALSTAVTAFFTLLVDILMLPKIRGIDMVESMKANE